MQVFQLTLTFTLRIFEFSPTATPFDSFYFVQVWRDKYVAAFLILIHQSDRRLGFTCSHNRVTYLNDHTLSSFAVLRYRKSNSQSGGVFVAEVERITAWARREYAESNIHTYRWYTDKEHRKPYYKRDYALVTITDPVAQQLEKLIALVSKKH